MSVKKVLMLVHTAIKVALLGVQSPYGYKVSFMAC